MSTELRFGSETRGRIPEGLFGLNLEITRNTFFNGLSAQLINNRRLYAGDGEPFARGWSAAGDCEMSPDGGRRRPLARLSAEPSGAVTEAPVTLLPNREYRWRLRVSGEFRARILLEVGSASTEVCCRGDGPAVTLEGSLFAQSAEETGRFSLTATGEGELRIEGVSLLPADAVLCGLRQDVIDALRTLRPYSLRFPGGCYAEYYDWRQGLLPQDEREVISVEGLDLLLGPTMNQDPCDMSLDDFAALCRMVGARPYYTVRMTGRTPEDAAALVEYANGGADTRWGAVRASRGYPEPYGIRRWFVGNEIYWTVPEMRDPLHAAEKTVEFARAMKRVDPTIELVPSNWVLEGDWNLRFTSELIRLGGGELFALASYHQYLLDCFEELSGAESPEKTPDPGTPELAARCLRAPTELILPRMHAVRGELRSAGAGEIPVILDEWNYYWGRSGRPLTALYMTGLFNLLIRHGAETGICETMFFHPINEGILRVTDTAVLTDDGGHAWRLARRHGGRELLPVECSDPDTPCDAAASAEGDTVYLTLVNRSLSESCEVTVPGLSSARMSEIECWRAENPGDWLRPMSMRPYRLSADGDGTLLLPPGSIAGVWLERG